MRSKENTTILLRELQRKEIAVRAVTYRELELSGSQPIWLGLSDAMTLEWDLSFVHILECFVLVIFLFSIEIVIFSQLFVGNCEELVIKFTFIVKSNNNYLKSASTIHFSDLNNEFNQFYSYCCYILLSFALSTHLTSIVWDTNCLQYTYKFHLVRLFWFEPIDLEYWKYTRHIPTTN